MPTSFTKTSDAIIVGPVSFDKTSDAIIVGPVSFTKTSDAVIGPPFFELSSDAIIGGGDRLTYSSNAEIESGPEPDGGGQIPAAPRFECPTHNTCPDPSIPTANLSSEAPDPGPIFFGSSTRQPYNNPRIGWRWDNPPVFVQCAALSQPAADDCAIHHQNGDDPGTPPGPPTPPPPPPGVPRPPPPNPRHVYGNHFGSCDVKCPDGSIFTATIPANSVFEYSQNLADRIASSIVCRRARQHRVCIALDKTTCCAGTKTTFKFTATGAFLDPQFNTWALRTGSLPSGFSFVADFAGPVLSLTGTPATDGKYDFQMRVTAPNGDYMEKSFTICVIGITPKTLTQPVIGTPYSKTLAVTNCAPTPVTWAVSSGQLPAGLALNSSTGVLTGTPTTAGIWIFTVTASSGVKWACSQDYLVVLGTTLIKLPCVGGGNPCPCNPSDIATLTVQGQPGKTYNLKLRIRSVSELNSTYTGGTVVPNTNSFCLKGGTTSDPDINRYSLDIDQPASNYWLNRGTGALVVAIMDYQFTVQAKTGATVTFTALAMNNTEVANPSYSVSNTPPPAVGVTQPYDGQFVQCDCLSAVAV